MTLTIGKRYAITYITGKRTFGTVFDAITVAGTTRYKIRRPDHNGWVSATTANIASAIPLDDYAVGDRVNTRHGIGTVTQAPTQMASGWTVRVDLDDKTTTPSGHARYAVIDITTA